MKLKSIQLAAWAMILAVSLSSCDELNIGNASMKADINNDSWNSITRVCLMEDNSISLTGIDTQGRTIILTVLGTGTGKYILNPFTVQFDTEAVYKSSDLSSLDEAWIAYSGEVNISEVNSEAQVISGDFEFNLLNQAGDTVKIRNGIFEDVKFN